MRSHYTFSNVVKPKRGFKSAIPDNVYLHAKRLALLTGCKNAESYLVLKGFSSDAELGAFRYRLLVEDARRDDVKLSKCMHCMFNKCCLGSPLGCQAAIDDRTPVWKIAFTANPFRPTKGRVIRQYECGWATYGDGVPVQVGVHEVRLVEYPEDASALLGSQGLLVTQCKPGNMGLVKSGVLPMKGEIYKRYLKRVSDLVKTLCRSLSSKGTDEEKLHDVFASLGQLDTLNTLYGGDVKMMARDYFPYKTVDEIIQEFASYIPTDEEVKRLAIDKSKEKKK